MSNDAVQPLLVILCNILPDKSFGVGQRQRHSQPNTFALVRSNLTFHLPVDEIYNLIALIRLESDAGLWCPNSFFRAMCPVNNSAMTSSFCRSRPSSFSMCFKFSFCSGTRLLTMSRRKLVNNCSARRRTALATDWRLRTSSRWPVSRSDGDAAP